MCRCGAVIERIDGDGTEYTELYGQRFLERRATFRLLDITCKRRPRQFDAGTFGLGGGGLRLSAADRGDGAFAARGALRRLVQVADRALAADRTVIEMGGLAPIRAASCFRIAIAPAQETDDVERLDVGEQFAVESASARFRASSSRVIGSRPAAMSFGRSTISPTPTMTGMRSSGIFAIFLFLLILRCLPNLVMRSAESVEGCNPASRA